MDRPRGGAGSALLRHCIPRAFYDVRRAQAVETITASQLFQHIKIAALASSVAPKGIAQTVPYARPVLSQALWQNVGTFALADPGTGRSRSDGMNKIQRKLETWMIIAIVSLAGAITAGLIAGACINVLLQLEDIDRAS